MSKKLKNRRNERTKSRTIFGQKKRVVPDMDALFAESRQICLNSSGKEKANETDKETTPQRKRDLPLQSMAHY